MRFINDVDIKGKRVFIRCDFNVPMDENGNITDDNRIRAALPTIQYAIDNKAKVILASHLGRPKGKPDPKYSLKAVAKRLSTLLGRNVVFIEDFKTQRDLIDALGDGDVALLENLRFYPEEEANSEEFARQLIELFDIYVNDAFGVCHRKHASVYALPKLALIAVGGFLLKKELDYFNKIFTIEDKPFVAVIGGAKVSGKLDCLINLIDKADKLIIGGAQAFTFLKALGYETGKSLVEDDLIDEAKRVMEKAKGKGVRFYLPVDFVCSTSVEDATNSRTFTYQEIPDDLMGLDIGPATIELFKEALSDAKVVVWNGPMGVFEVNAFANGTNEIAKAIGNLNALSVVGGGDTAEAVEKAGQSHNMSYISTGGGASLKLLEGKTLPVVEVLESKS
ncbi:phosphoglycerate kinase [Hippea maritima]|uniref:Phosphoglycerate kinase n=1 Tax=Hippea maritima (strain ATCC 700847 / DSM 10411 / MH2) TaxID=760142 RepID=F2LX79_HIPMA|nr:phosphoglycerate kinase [Hippea maritima]AEA33137.1 Phosphoglycerate kinase [Hippea maritima DSM 10411]